MTSPPACGPLRRRWQVAVGTVAIVVAMGACSAAPAAAPVSSPTITPSATTAAPSHADHTVPPRPEVPDDPASPPAPTSAPATPSSGATADGDPSTASADTPGTTPADPDGSPPGDEGYPARPTDPAPAPDEQFEDDVWVPAGDHRVPGTLALPSADGGMAPAVLLLHGDFGDRHASSFDELQETLAAHGIASLAIDFAGSGESEESAMELSYDSMMADANASFDYLLRDPELDPGKVAVLGFSRGGAIAATMAGTRPDVAALITWSGAVYNGQDELPEMHDEAREDGEAHFGDLEIPLAWFDSLEASHPLDDVAAYTGPVLAVVGSADDIVDPSYAQTFLDTVASQDKTLHVIDGADHGYSDEPEYGEDAVTTTTDWTIKRLLP